MTDWTPDPRYLRISADELWVRPRLLTRVTVAVVVLLLVVFAALALALGSSVGSADLADKVSLFGIGVVIAGLVLLLTRPRLRADGAGLRVRNLGAEVVLPWAAVRAVVVKDGTPWATVDLRDDEQVSLLALQTGDGPQATAALRALRRLHQAAVSPLSDPCHPADPEPPA